MIALLAMFRVSFFLLLFVPVVESDAFVSVWAAKALRLAGDFTPSVLTAADQGLLITLFSPNFVPINEKSRASQYNLFREWLKCL